MIEFHETLDDINNATVWDIYYGSRKVGSLRKELFNKVGKTMHGGKYYLNILYKDYTLPFSMKDMIPKICNGAIDNFEADMIITKIEQTDWHKQRVQRSDRYFNSINN